MNNLIQNLSNIDLSAMNNPQKCRIILRYAEIKLGPNNLAANIDWTNQVIKLKSGKTRVLAAIHFNIVQRISLFLSDIIDYEHEYFSCRIELIKEWSQSHEGRSLICKAFNLPPTANFITIPITDSQNEIHICVLNLDFRNFTILNSVQNYNIQCINMFIDLADGYINHLSSAGSLLHTSVNIMKSIFAAIKSVININFTGSDISDGFSVSLPQFVYNSIAYFPELQIVWENTDYLNLPKNNIPISEFDKLMIKYPSGQKILEKKQTEFQHKRQSSWLSETPTKLPKLCLPSQATRFSSLWPDNQLLK